MEHLWANMQAHLRCLSDISSPNSSDHLPCDHPPPWSWGMVAKSRQLKWLCLRGFCYGISIPGQLRVWGGLATFNICLGSFVTESRTIAISGASYFLTLRWSSLWIYLQWNSHPPIGGYSVMRIGTQCSDAWGEVRVVFQRGQWAHGHGNRLSFGQGV